MKTDTEKMEHIVGSCSESIQHDLLSILDGLDNQFLDNVCGVIVDRTKDLTEKLKQFTENCPPAFAGN